MNIDSVLKLIAESVIKLPSKQKKFETVESLRDFNNYKIAYYKTHTIYSYTYKIDDFLGYTFKNKGDKTDSEIIQEILADISMIKYYMKNEDIDILLSAKGLVVTDNYVEKNNYTRMLNGEPVYGTDDITLEEFNFHPSLLGNIRTDIPLSSLTSYEITKLKQDGLMDTIIAKYPAKEYIKYLHRRTPYINSRDADDFGLIYCSAEGVDTRVIDKFKDMYAKNLKYYNYVLRNEFFETYLKNYERMTVIFLLIWSASETITSMSIMKYDVDANDPELIQTILESNGMEYVELPEINLRRLIESTNNLMSMKGSKQVLIDIKEIFEVNNMYRYILHKPIRKNEWDENISNDDKYVLSFYKVPIEVVNIRPYLENENNRIPFKSMVEDDEYWGDPNVQDNLYQELIDIEFNQLETKYISIENMFELSKSIYDISTILRFLMNNKELLDVYSITYKRGTWTDITIFSVIQYMSLLVINTRGYTDIIYDGIPEITQVLGMDVDVDLTDIEWLYRVEFAHLEDDKELPNNIMRPEGTTTIYDFMNVYLKDRVVLDRLRAILSETRDIKTYQTAKVLYDAITINNTMYDTYINPKTGTPFNKYEEYIEYHNPTLYNNFKTIRHDVGLLKGELQYVIELLEEKLNQEKDPLLGSFIDGLNSIKMENINIINDSLKSIITYFKSMSVELKDFSSVYRLDNKLNRFAIMDVGHNTYQDKVIEPAADVGSKDEFYFTDKAIFTSHIKTGNNFTYRDNNGIGGE